MKQTIIMLFSRSKIALVVILLFIFGLLAGIFFSFPEMKIKQLFISSIERQGHIVIEQGDIDIGFFSIEGSDLLIRPENPLWAPISINSLQLTPLWLSLLTKNPGVHLDMQLSGGTLLADVFRDGTLMATASQLNLAPLLPKDQAVKVSGQLAEMKLSGAIPLGKASESFVALTLKNIKATGNRALKMELNLGDIVIKGTGRGRSFKIISLKADGGDLSISGKGSLLLSRDLPSTRGNIKLEIRPEETADPMVVELLKLGTRQTTNGRYELSLSGSLSEL